MIFYNKHYIRVDDENSVIHGFSDAFEEPKDNDILINEQGGRQFELLDEINPPLRDWEGNFLYKWDGNKVIKIQVLF